MNKQDKERLSAFDEKLSAVMPKDMKCWWQNSKEEWPEVAASTIKTLKEDRDLGWKIAADNAAMVANLREIVDAVATDGCMITPELQEAAKKALESVEVEDV